LDELELLVELVLVDVPVLALVAATVLINYNHSFLFKLST
jgi:hypothetical protein